MVAMIDPRSLTTMFVVERNAAAQPVTVMIVDATERAESGRLYRLVSVEDEAAAVAGGEPTWEDAAWQ